MGFLTEGLLEPSSSVREVAKAALLLVEVVVEVKESTSAVLMTFLSVLSTESPASIFRSSISLTSACVCAHKSLDSISLAGKLQIV